MHFVSRQIAKLEPEKLCAKLSNGSRDWKEWDYYFISPIFFAILSIICIFSLSRQIIPNFYYFIIFYYFIVRSFYLIKVFFYVFAIHLKSVKLFT